MAETLGRSARARCVERYSFATARRRLYALVDGLASPHAGP